MNSKLKNLFFHSLFILTLLLIDLLTIEGIINLLRYIPKDPFLIYFLILPLYFYGIVISTLCFLVFYVKNENYDIKFKSELNKSISWISSLLVSLALLLTAGHIDIAVDAPVLFLITGVTTEIVLSQDIYNGVKDVINNYLTIFLTFISATLIILALIFYFNQIYRINLF